MSPEVLIRTYKESDLKKVVRVFKNTIFESGPEQYTLQQIEVWSSYPDDLDEFNALLLKGLTYVAQAKRNIVSFGTLNPADRIEFIYTLKKYSNMGIASSIYKLLDNYARDQKVREINTDVSKIVMPFFTKAGFKIVKKETVIRKNTKFERYRMFKELSDDQVI